MRGWFVIFCTLRVLERFVLCISIAFDHGRAPAELTGHSLDSRQSEYKTAKGLLSFRYRKGRDKSRG